MKFESGKIHVTSAEVKALVSHTAKRGADWRPLMACVHFALAEARAYATCGHRMVGVRAAGPPQSGAKTVSVRAADLRRLVKFPGAKRFEIAPDADGKRATAAAFDETSDLGSYRLDLDEVKLPDNFGAFVTEPRVDAPRSALFCLDLGFVADLRPVLEAAGEGDGGKDFYFVAPYDPLSPAHFVAGNWVAAIMPRRSDTCVDAAGAVDAWRQAVAARQAESAPKPPAKAARVAKAKPKKRPARGGSK